MIACDLTPYPACGCRSLQAPCGSNAEIPCLGLRRKRNEVVVPPLFVVPLLISSVLGQSITFVDATSTSLLAYPSSIGQLQGVAVGDYDNDGWEDLCFCGNSVVGVIIFRNLGDKTFENVTSTVLPANMPNAAMSLFADIDGDGDLDLLLARYETDALHTCLDYLINDNGTFSAVDSSCKGAQYDARAGGLVVADPDRDGDLDIVMTHWDGPGWYFVNSGSLSFSEVAAQRIPGLEFSTFHYAPVFVDFNNNGWPDLHVAVDVDSDYHARNLGGGNFENMSSQWDSAEGSSDMGIACGDIENDGDLDFFVTNIGQHVLHVNDGSGLFSEESLARGVQFNGGEFFGWGTAFVDFDHDTDLDLVFVTTGTPGGSLFENDGLGFFTDITAGSGMILLGAGLAPFDYDKDGDMDLIIADSSRPFLYENVTPSLVGRHWLQVELQGIDSNTKGIGARISVTVNGLTMIRELLGSYSFFAGPPVRAHFGLGSASLVETLRIQWPSGRIQILEDVAVDQHLVVTEPDGLVVPTTSTWSVVIMLMLIATAGSLVFSRRRAMAH